MAKEYVLDGSKVTSLDAFYDEIAKAVSLPEWWGRNLDALDDILSGGFGTPDEGFILRWTHSRASRDSLGYPETVRQLQNRLRGCHPTNRESVQAELNQAQQGRGATVFDWLVELIRDHGAGGNHSQDNVRLVLD